ncbi:hypothetical protein [Brevundimonas nasdae]|uniref:hypothetical protein n=1 Tax=Brevundimonas nasdae TaxID=172043 RepID=UPI003F692C96
MSLSPDQVEQILEAIKSQQDATLVALQRQQMIAAWISAGAAILQAVGAALAIFFSVKLARESADREAKAQREATKREIEAEAAALDRARRSDVKNHNAPIGVVLALTDLFIDFLCQEKLRFGLVNDGSHHMTRLFNTDSQNLRAAIDSARGKIVDPATAKALNSLYDLTSGRNPGAALAAQVSVMFQTHEEKVKIARADLAACLWAE